MNMAFDNAVSGYLVVRRPELNVDLGMSEKRVRGALYCGIDRMRWADIVERYYGKSLPADCFRLYESIRQSSSDDSGIDLARDLASARALCGFDPVIESVSEVVAVWSPVLSSVKGWAPFEDASVDWLGFDVVPLGWWSMIADGPFKRADAFPMSCLNLNSSGLLADIGGLSVLADEYAGAASAGWVEPYPDAREPVWIRVGRLPTL